MESDALNGGGMQITNEECGEWLDWWGYTEFDWDIVADHKIEGEFRWYLLDGS